MEVLSSGIIIIITIIIIIKYLLPIVDDSYTYIGYI